MKVEIKVSSGKILEINAKVLDKRQMFGRKEVLIEGRLAKPIWITTPKK